LWVRSYWWLDTNLDGRHPVASYQGKILFNKQLVLFGSRPVTLGTKPSLPQYGISSIQIGTPGTGINFLDGGVTTPYWLVVSLAVATTFAPWLPRRFSLRTLLIATTLVAVVQGLVVAYSR
jgi:hypothetical protein